MKVFISHRIFNFTGIIKLMDDNQNSNQEEGQNTSDGGGIFGSFMNANIPQTNNTQTQNDAIVSENPNSNSTNIQSAQTFADDTQSDSVFDSVIARGNSVNSSEKQATPQVFPQTPFQNKVSDPGEKKTSEISSTEEQNPKTDFEELESLGVTVVNEAVKPQNTTVFDANSQFKNTQTIQGVPLKQVTTMDTQELEKDFSETFSERSFATSSKDSIDLLDQEEQKLKKLHVELKARAEQKKQKVKEGLEKLKKEKELLGKELQEIKEIEEIATKIAEKIQNLEQIDTELDDIEKRARAELS